MVLFSCFKLVPLIIKTHSLMKKLLSFYFLLITSCFGAAQTWSSVGGGLSPNILQVNSLYTNNANQLVVCNSFALNRDSVPVWNGSTYLHPYDTLARYGFCWICIPQPDTITYCAAEIKGVIN